jgi:tetratricopeptide (TPR) repeat protein
MRRTKTILTATILSLCGLTGTIASAPTAQAAQSQASNVAYAEAQKQWRAGNLPEAARIFYMLVTQSEGDVRAKAEFGLAEALKGLQLLHSSAFFYLRMAAQGPQNPFFRHSLSALASINAQQPLGRSAISLLFQGKININPLMVPNDARGFYHFYRGLEFYEHENIKDAAAEFERVPSNSPYYSRAMYYQGVMRTLTKDLDGATTSFKRALRNARKDSFKELSILALARLYYEQKQIRTAFDYYSQIPRDSDLWLQSLFEGAWGFFLISKSNNTLGNIHTLRSPFFQTRFFPESYVLEAITYLRLCYFQKVDLALAGFQQRYKATFQDLNNLLKKYQEQPAAFFNLNVQYRNSGDLREFPAAAEIVDSTARSDSFKEAVQVIRAMEREERAIARMYASRWENAGLSDILRDNFSKRKMGTLNRTGNDLFAQAVQAFRYLKDLSDQTKLINYERATSQTDQIRAKFNAEPLQMDGNTWGEGMKPLDLKRELEYWPFEGEWWEDELGSYVYNISSKCGAGADTKPKQK